MPDRIEAIEVRLAKLEDQGRRDRGLPAEAYRDAALQLNAAIESQRRAFELQLEATRLLNDTVAEQASIIAGLLVGDPSSNSITEITVSSD